MLDGYHAGLPDAKPDAQSDAKPDAQSDAKHMPDHNGSDRRSTIGIF